LSFRAKSRNLLLFLMHPKLHIADDVTRRRCQRMYISIRWGGSARKKRFSRVCGNSLAKPTRSKPPETSAV